MARSLWWPRDFACSWGIFLLLFYCLLCVGFSSWCLTALFGEVFWSLLPQVLFDLWVFGFTIPVSPQRPFKLLLPGCFARSYVFVALHLHTLVIGCDVCISVFRSVFRVFSFLNGPLFWAVLGHLDVTLPAGIVSYILLTWVITSTHSSCLKLALVEVPI